MNLKNSLITALGGVPKLDKTTNRVDPNSFLRYGSRGRLVLSPDWAEVKITDEDVYRGYPYAVIQKRANKVASLAKENLNTWVKPEALDIFQKKGYDPIHPYLKIIEDSTDFSTKQFWKTICIYLDLAGAYYLGVLRNKIPSKSLDKKNFPDLYSDVSQFILLNPYQIKRILNQDGEVAGYLETRKDGRQREWPLHMIIPMRELNPFDSDKVWSMTDAAKEETYTLKQSGSFTRETLTHNLNAPGIISTDVILDDRKFADFVERVRNHTKGEPLFGNGTGAITWAGMQQDLDKSALLDINEINRTALFAVSGTSKTALGIEQSGTTRETARVQTEQFISDTAQPRLEDIVDYLNLDYKIHYKSDYDKVGYWLEIKSASSRDYATETQATQMRQAQSDLAFSLMQKGYTMESSYDYAEGKIELSELELEKGLDKPKSEETPPEDAPPENTPSDAPESPTSDDTAEDDTTTVPEETEENTALANLEGLEPHAQLKTNSSEEAHDHVHCDCGKVEVLINELEESDGKTLEESYKKFLNDIEEIQKETYKACVSKLTVNAFTEDDIIGKRKKQALTNKLKAIIQNYWWILTPLLANSIMEERDSEYGENVKFVFTNALQEKVENNATRVADGHIQTILDDVLTASNKAYTSITEEKAAELIVKAYKENEAKYHKWFEEQPSMTEALKAIRNTDILEENRKIYERANELAIQGYKREDIIKKIREEYKHLSKRRAELIAQNETSRAYSHSQYEADTQFLNSIGQLDTAYKELYSLRPDSEKDKICPICQEIINRGPIPFTQNFVSLGETITAEQDGKVYNFVCNYENIEGGTIHPRCFCRYRLILNGKTLNELPSNEPNPNDGSNGGLNDNNLDSQAKAVNGGPGSGYFGHAGRPGLIGGSTKDTQASSATRRRSFTRGDIVEIRTKGKTYTGEILDWDKVNLSEVTYKQWDGSETTMKVPTVILKTDKGEERLPFSNVRMLRNADAVDAVPVSERQTKLQKEALDEVGKMIKVGDDELNYLRKNCAEETAVALRDELKKAVDDGIDLQKVVLQHNNRLERTQARVNYRTHARNSTFGDFELELSGKMIADGKVYRERQQKSYEDGWHTSGEIAGSIRHELGHIKSAQLLLRKWDASPNTGPVIRAHEVDWRNDLLCQRIVQAAGYNMYKMSYGKGKDISEYGVKDHKWSEVVAEAYSNPNFSEATKAIATELDKQFKSQNNSFVDKIVNEAKLDNYEGSLCTGYPLSKEDWEILHGKVPEYHQPLQ